MDKLVLLTVALLCAGILCACGDGAPDDAPSSTAVIDSIMDDDRSSQTAADTDENETTIAVPDDTENIDATARELIADI